MTKYTKIEQMAQRSALTKLFLGPLRLASGQKQTLAILCQYQDHLNIEEIIELVRKFL